MKSKGDTGIPMSREASSYFDRAVYEPVVLNSDAHLSTIREGELHIWAAVDFQRLYVLRIPERRLTFINSFGGGFCKASCPDLAATFGPCGLGLCEPGQLSFLRYSFLGACIIHGTMYHAEIEPMPENPPDRLPYTGLWKVTIYEG